MFKSYLRMTMRILLRGKLHSAIKIGGLSVGIACSLLLALLIRHEWSFDSFQERGGRIFRMVTQRTNADGTSVKVALSPIPLAPALQESFPQVARSLSIIDDQITIISAHEVFKQPVLFASSSFFEMFSFPLLRGDPHTVLTQRSSILLTSSVAEKIFGSEDPIGKTLSIVAGERIEVVVSGVAADPPPNTSVPFAAILPLELVPGYRSLRTNWGSSNGYTFVELRNGADPSVLTEALRPFVQKHYADRIREGRESGNLHNDDPWRLLLQPLGDVHTNPTVRWGLVPAINPLRSFVLGGIALVIVLIACLNFAILSVARASDRAREIGLRKVAGAKQSQVFVQFWGEALITTIAATAVGLVLAELLIPAFNRFTLRDLSIQDSFSVVTAVVGLLCVAVIALLSEGYPALLLSRLKPVDAFRTRLRLHKSGLIGKGVVVTQFVLGIVLMVGAVMMHHQMSFVETRDLGYSPRDILVLPVQGVPYGSVQTLLSEASSIRGVSEVATVNNTFTRGGMRTELSTEGKAIGTEVFFVNSDFIRTLGLTLKEGEDFPLVADESSPGRLVVNESFVKESGWATAIGKQVDLGGTAAPVTGVVKDFNFRSLKTEIQPAVFYLNSRASASNVLIRLETANLSQTLTGVEQLWKRVIPFEPFEYYFLDADVQRQYLEDVRWNEIVLYAAAVSLFLAGAGLFGIASVSASRRTKEVGIRKVLGSSITGILVLLTKDIVGLVALANVIAWPIAYVAVQTWLESFAYRADWNVTVFILSGIGSMTLAFLATAFQSVVTALGNPVDALRVE